MCAADLIVTNADVHTMDLSQPSAAAFSVVGDRVLAVGAEDLVRTQAGLSTRVVDAGGCTVLPGFNDAHVHFLAGGFSLENVNLRACASLDELARKLGAYAARLSPGAWILGGDWDHENWSQTSPFLPTRSSIDPATRRNPVMVTRLDGHMALANSIALKLAGITPSTPDPPGGVIVRDAKTGEPTGILKDSAQSLVEKVIPPRSEPAKRAAIVAASRHAASCGVTSVTDMSADDDLVLYHQIADAGDLVTRVYAARSIGSWEKAANADIRAACSNHLVRSGLIKGFCDGSLGSSTALFFEPYADDARNRGLLFDQMLPEGLMQKRVLGADRAGLQVAIHAIGDEANSRILDLFSEVAANNTSWDRRFRIEHAQHLRPCDIGRFVRQGVIASMQPYHAADDGRWCERRLGKIRCQTAYAFRSLLEHGTLLAFGSDWTVAPLNPLLGIKAAVTRHTLDGANPNGWVPEQKITLDQAIRAYTVGSAYAEFSETSKGTITPGKLADFVVLDRDIYRSEAAELDKARVKLTCMGGRVIYDTLE